MSKLKVLNICLWSLLANIVLYGQHENNLWLFSPNEIIDFSTGEPVVREDDQLLIPPAEASFTLSDSLGNVIFHTDSETIINRHYQVMPNGSDIGGDRSSWQGILCVHNPSEPNIYHLFVTFSSLYHLIIDLNADNGNGDVISKNEIWSTSKEHITGFPHPCGGVWIISHDSGINNKFLSFHFRDGIIYPPVISEIGTINDTIYSPGGLLRLSPNGKILASTNVHNHLEFYDFNSIDGSIKNSIMYSPLSVQFGGTKYYSGEFSPNSKYFYTLKRAEFRDSIYYLQLDLDNIDIGIIEELTIGYISKTSYDGLYFLGSINRGTNNKIYMVHHPSNRLASIESPNLKGNACDFNPEVLLLQDFSGLFNYRRNVTLSPLIEYFDSSNMLSLPPDTILCEGEELVLDFNSIDDTIIWENGNMDKVRSITSSGTYHATFITPTGCIYSDTFYVEVIPREEVTIIQEICPGDSIELAGEWYQIGDNRVDTIDIDGCPGILTVQVEEYPPPFTPPLFPSDTTICVGDSVVVDLSLLEGVFQWSDDLVDPERTIYEAGSYIVTYTTMKGCMYTDTMNIQYLEESFIQLDTILCYGDELFIGQDTVMEPGIYQDTLTDEYGCLMIKEIMVEMDSSSLIHDTTRISIADVSGYEWNGMTYSTPGIYAYETINDNGCEVIEYLDLQVEREIAPEIILSNILSVNDDGINDELRIYRGSEEEYIVSTFQIYSRWGNVVHRQPGPIPIEDLTWDGKINNEALPSGVYTYLMIYKRQDSLEEEVKTGTITLKR